MKNLIICFTALILTGCSVDAQNIENEITDIKEDAFALDANSDTKDPYTIDFNIEPINDNEYYLTIMLEPDSGAYFIAPSSNGNYSGIFKTSVTENTNITLSDSILEFPQSFESFAEWRGGPANFVDVKTIYKQRFTVNTQNNFETTGIVQFVIELKCTLETYEFIISSKSGVITVAYEKKRGC